LFLYASLVDVVYASSMTTVVHTLAMALNGLGAMCTRQCNPPPGVTLHEAFVVLHSDT
jgi:hypothetical protein